MATLINGDGNGAVYAAQDADWFAGVEGNATKRLNIGLKMAYEIEDANTIAVKDGVIVTKEGRRIQIDAGAIDEFIIPTGSQGVTRYFIIGYHLYTDASSNQLCETFVQLMASASDTIPENTFRGGSTEVYISLYRVTQNGLTLDTIQSLLPERTTIDAVKSEIDTANKMDNIVDCSTARNVAAKTVSLSGFVLRNSAKVVVRFTNTGTTNPSSGNLTLNVNNTGAKNIIDGHTNNTTMTYSNAGNFCNNQVCEFIYNGTAWVWLNRDSNTTYTGGTLKTAAAKTGSGSTVTNTIAANTTIDNAIGTLLNNDYKINSDLTELGNATLLKEFTNTTATDVTLNDSVNNYREILLVLLSKNNNQIYATSRLPLSIYKSTSMGFMAEIAETIGSSTTVCYWRAYANYVDDTTARVLVISTHPSDFSRGRLYGIK